MLQSAQPGADELHVCLPNVAFSIQIRDHLGKVLHERLPLDPEELRRAKYSIRENAIVERHTKAILVFAKDFLRVFCLRGLIYLNAKVSLPSSRILLSLVLIGSERRPATLTRLIRNT